MKQSRRSISKTPRSPSQSRKVHFSLSMRRRISENWIALRKGIAQKKTQRKKKK